MVGRFVILALCVLGAYSSPVSKAGNARTSLTPTQVDSIVDALNQIEGIINIHSAKVNPEAQSSLTPTQVVDILNQIEGIINIHSAQARGGVINIPGFIDAVESILGQLQTRSSLTPSQVDNVVNILNQIEGIINIHSAKVNPEAQSSLTPTQVVDILNQIEGIININSAQARGGVINIPGFIDAVESILGQLQTRSSLTPSQVDNVVNILNQIEGIINIHSAKSIPDTGVINWPVVDSVVGKIEGILTGLKARTTSLTPTQVDNIVNILNQIEGIINIHSAQTRSVINIPGFIDAVGSILGQLNARSTPLTPTQVENIIDILNQIEGIINIH